MKVSTTGPSSPSSSGRQRRFVKVGRWNNEYHMVSIFVSPSKPLPSSQEHHYRQPWSLYLHFNWHLILRSRTVNAGSSLWWPAEPAWSGPRTAAIPTTRRNQLTRRRCNCLDWVIKVVRKEHSSQSLFSIQFPAVNIISYWCYNCTAEV